MSEGNSAANWIAGVAVILAVPGALLAWSQLDDGSGERSSGAAASTAASETESETSDSGETTGGGLPAPTPEDGALDESDFDVTNCLITVDHIGAQIHGEPDHSARALSSVPSGEYSPLDAREVEWAGRDELWFQLEVDGRVGWLVDNTIFVTSKSSGCP